MESRRLKYLYILKSRAPRALRRPVESCKDSPNRRVPAGPALRTTPLARRGRLARAALHGRAPGPLPSCPRGQHAAWRRRVGSIRATTRREPPSAVSRSRHAARARAVARRAEPPAYVTRRVRERRAARRAARVPERRPVLVGRAVVLEVDEVRRRGARPPHALHPAARRPARGRRRRARARFCTPRWSRHGPRLAGPRPKRRLTGLFIGGVRVRVDLY